MPGVRNQDFVSNNNHVFREFSQNLAILFMKRLGNPLISISAPLLILLAITGILQTEGNEKIQAIPALVVGSGLVLTGTLRRFRRRRMLLIEIKKDMDD